MTDDEFDMLTDRDVRELVDELQASLADARHCLMLMMEKHHHWVFDIEATEGQKSEMERARAAALVTSGK